MKSLCFICALLVLPLTADGLIREYINVQLSMNWTQAQNYCADAYRGLAVITNQDEYQRVREVGDTGWIGVFRSSQDSNLWLWTDQKTYSYFPWSSGQPNNYNNLQHCVRTEPGGWNDYFCWETESFYCYRSVILVEVKMTWEQALDYCRTHYKNLAYPTSESQIQLAEQEAMQNQALRVWAGMRFLNGNWYWVNGERLGSSVSIPSCPPSSFHCGARNIMSHVWENRQCNEKLPFLCYW